MNPTATQQATLGNALVPPEKRLKIERCNARIAFSKPQREETYQVTLEALKLSSCYPAFLITAEICPRILNQDFIAPPSEEDLVTFIQELGYSGRYFMYQADNRETSSTRKEHMPYPRFTKVIINHFISKDKTISMRNRINLHIIRDDSLLDIKDPIAYKTYYDFVTGKVPPMKARNYKKVASPSRKLSPVKEAKHVKKTKRVNRPARKSTSAPRTGVAIRDNLGVFVSKKKAPIKADRSKGIEILSDVALSEATQLKEATKRSKKDYDISQASGSGDGTDFESEVPDEKQRKTSSTYEGTSTKPRVPDVPT
ncbi:hypothetical protein Tco_0526778 [Tanacetum coccineum]